MGQLLIAPAALAQGLAAVRLIHALPDAPGIALYANGKPLMDQREFGGASDYITLKPGKYQFQIALAGADVSAAPALEATVAAGTFYTVAATGQLPNIKPALFLDDLSAPATGQAALRVYHLSPDAPAIDLTIKDGARLVYNLPFPQASDYLTVGAGHYHLQILPATVEGPVLVDLPSANLEADKINELFMFGALIAIQPKVISTPPQTLAKPAELPRTGGDTLPLALIAGLAWVLLACGVALRRPAQR
jgi:hypothetical protein